MRAGQLREAILIQNSTIMKDGYGADSLQWVDVISTRAKVTYATGSRENQNNEIVYSCTIQFTIRYYHDVLESMRIIWREKKYRIISINKELDKQSITIITELVNE